MVAAVQARLMAGDCDSGSGSVGHTLRPCSVFMEAGGGVVEMLEGRDEVQVKTRLGSPGWQVQTAPLSPPHTHTHPHHGTCV